MSGSQRKQVSAEELAALHKVSRTWALEHSEHGSPGACATLISGHPLDKWAGCLGDIGELHLPSIRNRGEETEEPGDAWEGGRALCQGLPAL